MSLSRQCLLRRRVAELCGVGCGGIDCTAGSRSRQVNCVLNDSTTPAQRVGDATGAQLVEQRRVPGAHELEQFALEPANVDDGDVVEVARGAGEDRHDLVVDGHRAVERLLEQLDHPVAAVELGLCGLSSSVPKLGERLELAERGEVELEPAGDLLHRRDLGLPPTRDTEMPTSTAGRTPAKNRSGCR